MLSEKWLKNMELKIEVIIFQSFSLGNYQIPFEPSEDKSNNQSFNF